MLKYDCTFICNISRKNMIKAILKMKLVVGVIATDCDYQINAQLVWKQYMHKNPNIKVYFLKFDNSKPDKSFGDDTFYCHSNSGKETIETMVTKSLEFMKVMLEDDSWDYILRTNLSSVFHWDRVLSLLSQNNHFDVIANNPLHGPCRQFLQDVVCFCHAKQSMALLTNG